jgi:hypothetical protein
MIGNGDKLMNVYQYCTPQWLEESAKRYHSTPGFKKELEKLSLTVCFRVESEPAWGIDKDIIFGACIEKGELLKLDFFSEEDAENEADFIMAATPQEWKNLLRKESKFIGDFMVGKISLEKGSKIGVLGIAPHSGTFINVLTQVELVFPDEMSREELDQYRSNLNELRAKIAA